MLVFTPCLAGTIPYLVESTCILPNNSVSRCTQPHPASRGYFHLYIWTWGLHKSQGCSHLVGFGKGRCMQPYLEIGKIISKIWTHGLQLTRLHLTAASRLTPLLTKLIPLFIYFLQKKVMRRCSFILEIVELSCFTKRQETT